MSSTRRELLVRTAALGGVAALGLGAGRARASTLTLVDGRRLEYLTAGSLRRPALVLHHGTPAAARLFASWAADVVRAGLCLVAYSRPGYGASDRRAERDVAQAAEDTAALLDHLGVERFVTAGWSGGGPHALACGALLPGRCRAVATLAGVAPYGADGLDFLAGMGPENVDEFGRALEGPAALTAWMAKNGPPLAAVTGAEMPASLGGLVDEADAAVLVGDFADELADATRWSVSEGFWGGSTTIWRSSARGASIWGRSARRSRCGRAGTTRWCRWRTGRGWRRTSRARRSGRSRTTGTSRS